VEELSVAWTWRRRRSRWRRRVVPMMVPERDGEGRADGGVSGHFDVE
jgi:hypothetical protein